LIVMRLLPRQSLLKRMLRRLGSRIFAGAQIGGRSARATLTARQRCQKDELRDETDVAISGPCNAARAPISRSTTIGWPSRCAGVGTSSVLSTRRRPNRAPMISIAPNGSERWCYCRWSA
jgi:hypothetical protein